MLGHHEVVVGAERHRPLHVVQGAVVLPVRRGGRRQAPGAPWHPGRRATSALWPISSTSAKPSFRHFPEPVVDASKAQEPIRAGVGRIGAYRRLEMLPRTGVVGPRVALQVLLRPQHMVVGLETVRRLGGDRIVGERRQPAGDGRSHGARDFELDVEQVLEPAVDSAPPKPRLPDSHSMRCSDSRSCARRPGGRSRRGDGARRAPGRWRRDRSPAAR